MLKPLGPLSVSIRLRWLIVAFLITALLVIGAGMSSTARGSNATGGMIGLLTGLSSPSQPGDGVTGGMIGLAGLSSPSQSGDGVTGGMIGFLTGLSSPARADH